MTTLGFILLALALIGIILYIGEFRFEYKIEKQTKNKTDEINKSSLDVLSNAELNILKLVCDGKTNQEIADILFISVHTVKKHMSNIFKKLNIQSRSETRKYKALLNNII